ELLHEPLKDSPPDLGVRHLAAAEEDGRLDLVAVLEEALDVLLLELVVVLVHLRAELDLFHQNHLLVPPGLARSLLLLVLVLAEIHDAADRRHRRRGDLDEVESLLFRNGQRGGRRHDAELLPGVVDHPDFADADALVHANTIVTSRASVESDNDLLLHIARASAPTPDALAPVCWRASETHS